jgi:catechol 2,3-dioxygenase-like lactoylglutathione lyase family enzyme
MRAGEIMEACLYAEDLDAAERFYTSVLGIEVIARVEGRTCSFAAAGACSWS